MSGTFTPRPGAAPLATQVLSQARMEARLLLRNGEQLLLAVVIPIIVLVGSVIGAERVGLDVGGRAVDVFTPGVLALAVMSTSFTSLAIMTAFERRYGVLKRLGASPLPRHGLLLGKVLALIWVLLGQLVLIGAAGALLGWHPRSGWAAALLMVALGTAAFASLGLFLGGALRAEATLAAANLIYLLLLAGGAVIWPSTSYGGFGGALRWLPSGALGDGLRAALLHGQLSVSSTAVLLGWAVIGTALTARTFSWE